MEREPYDKPIRRSKGFIFQNADKRRALDFTEGRDPKKFLHRQMQDFSEAELQELQHKLAAWVKSPRVLPTYLAWRPVLRLAAPERLLAQPGLQHRPQAGPAAAR